MSSLQEVNQLTSTTYTAISNDTFEGFNDMYFLNDIYRDKSNNYSSNYNASTISSMPARGERVAKDVVDMEGNLYDVYEQQEGATESSGLNL